MDILNPLSNLYNLHINMDEIPKPATDNIQLTRNGCFLSIRKDTASFEVDELFYFNEIISVFLLVKLI